MNKAVLGMAAVVAVVLALGGCGRGVDVLGGADGRGEERRGAITDEATLPRLAELAVTGTTEQRPEAQRRLRAASEQGLQALHERWSGDVRMLRFMGSLDEAEAMAAFEAVYYHSMTSNMGFQWHDAGLSPQAKDDPVGHRARLEVAFNVVSGQFDGLYSGLYWHTDFEQAKAAAKLLKKPILSARLVGRMDEDMCSAAARVMRTVVYCDDRVIPVLGMDFVLHWESVAPAQKISIDFGDGRKLERTMAAAVAHYVCDFNGRVVEALPGIYAPGTFAKAIAGVRWLAQEASVWHDDNLKSVIRVRHREDLKAPNIIEFAGRAEIPLQDTPGKLLDLLNLPEVWDYTAWPSEAYQVDSRVGSTARMLIWRDLVTQWEVAAADRVIERSDMKREMVSRKELAKMARRASELSVSKAFVEASLFGRFGGYGEASPMFFHERIVGGPTRLPTLADSGEAGSEDGADQPAFPKPFRLPDPSSVYGGRLQGLLSRVYGLDESLPRDTTMAELVLRPAIKRWSDQGVELDCKALNHRVMKELLGYKDTAALAAEYLGSDKWTGIKDDGLKPADAAPESPTQGK